MKNVTIALDDDIHRQARIRAAEMGTSLSALVKAYLVRLAEEGAAPAGGVREMPMPYKAPPSDIVPAAPPQLFTKDGKLRQPGALRDLWIAEDFDEWPQDVQASFEAWDHDEPKPE